MIASIYLMTIKLLERSITVSSALDWGLKGC